jgi:hypothetical protein
MLNPPLQIEATHLRDFGGTIRTEPGKPTTIETPKVNRATRSAVNFDRTMWIKRDPQASRNVLAIGQRGSSILDGKEQFSPLRNRLNRGVTAILYITK